MLQRMENRVALAEFMHALCEQEHQFIAAIFDDRLKRSPIARYGILHEKSIDCCGSSRFAYAGTACFQNYLS